MPRLSGLYGQGCLSIVATRHAAPSTAWGYTSDTAKSTIGPYGKLVRVEPRTHGGSSRSCRHEFLTEQGRHPGASRSVVAAWRNASRGTSGMALSGTLTSLMMLWAWQVRSAMWSGARLAAGALERRSSRDSVTPSRQVALRVPTRQAGQGSVAVITVVI